MPSRRPAPHVLLPVLLAEYARGSSAVPTLPADRLRLLRELLTRQLPLRKPRLPFGEWTNIFPNAACATALIDRVIHHADVIAIEGSSYRRRTAEENASSRRTARAKK